MNDELISIVIPVYKVEGYIHRCVDSIIKQDYRNVEIVLIDDGSPDSCPAICDEYAKKNIKVNTYHKENGGLSSARNYGVQKAQGDYIIFVDSDDYVECTYVSDLISLMKKFDSDMAVTRIIRETETGKRRTGERNIVEKALSPQEAFVEIYSGKNVGWEACGKIYRKQLLLDNPFPDGYYEDFATLYKIIGDSHRIAIGNYEVNYHYIVRKGSILNSSFNIKHLHVFDICDELEQYIMSKYPVFDYLPYLLYERAIIQLVKSGNMNRSLQRKIYKKYKNKFREGLKPILSSRNVSINSKCYALVLSIGFNPFIVFERVVALRNS